jgi:hypothetical protein
VTATGELPQFVRDLLAAGPPSAGEGVHTWLYRTARVLHPYRTEDAIGAILCALVDGCGRIVSEREIADAVRNSKAAAWKPGAPIVRSAPRWPTRNSERIAAIQRTGMTLADLWEMSPYRIETNRPRTEEIIDALFPGNPLLCCGKSAADFATRPRETWRGGMAALQFIVPSPMTARTGRTQDGRESAHCLDNTGERRFLVIEQDAGTVDDQATILAHLAERAPLALVVHSGSKSLHGWFFCAGQSEDRLRIFMRYAVTLGADRATWTRSQFVRMPDGRRDNGNRQTVYFFNPEIVR